MLIIEDGCDEAPKLATCFGRLHPNRGCLDHILQFRYAETLPREPPCSQIGMHPIVHEFEAHASSAADRRPT
jgi:hypothetical protein